MADDPYNDLTGILTSTQEVATSMLLPMFVGFQVQLILFGLCLSMFADYIGSDIWQRHTRKMKVTLWSVMFFLFLNALLALEELIYYGVRQRRTYDEIIRAHWPSALEPLLAGLVAAMVQVLLTFRAAAFFPRDWRRAVFLSVNLCAILLSLFGVSAVTGIGYLYGLDINAVERALPLTWSNCTLIWLISASLVDISISAGLYYTLRSRVASSIAGWAFKSLINKALQTAMYTAVMAVVGAAMAGVSISQNQSAAFIDIPYAFWLPMPTLYVLSLFTTLSSNKSISKRLTTHRGTTNPSGFQPGRLAASYAQHSFVAPSPNPAAVKVGLSGAAMAPAGEDEKDLDKKESL